jgi:5-methylcytosine-specific restriction endonuclease McrA
MSKIKKICITCNKSFFVKPCRKNEAKFCSHSCYAKSLIGCKQSIASNKKRSDTHKKLGIKPPHPGWGKNNIFYGQKHSEKTKLHWSKIRTGLKIEKECELCRKKFQIILSSNRKFCSRECSDLYYVGENGHNWKGGITKLRDLLRRLPEYKEWRNSIFTRDNFTCQICNKKNSGNLNAHHIKMISEIFEENNIKTVEEAITCKELWDINNGITLCSKCHGKIRWHEKEHEETFLKILQIA